MIPGDQKSEIPFKTSGHFTEVSILNINSYYLLRQMYKADKK